MSRQLGNLKVLTMLALYITAHCGNGLRPAAGEKMEQGLFLDGVHILGNDFPVDQRIQNTIPVFPDHANAAFAGIDDTAMGAEIALHLIVFHPVIKSGLLHGYLLYYLSKSIFTLNLP